MIHNRNWLRASLAMLLALCLIVGVPTVALAAPAGSCTDETAIAVAAKTRSRIPDTTGSTLHACLEALREVFPQGVRISIATLAFVGGVQ